MTVELQWHDLLGKPFRLPGSSSKGMTCFDVAAEVTRRLYGDDGGLLHPRSGVNLDQCVPASVVCRDECVEEGQRALWSCVGSSVADAVNIGDIVAAGSGGVARSVYIRVDSSRPTFLTATRSHGVISYKSHLIKDVIGVYRRRQL